MKKYIVLATVILATLSCDDNFLDRAPYDGLSDQTIWNSEENSVMAVNGIYSSLAFSALNQFYYYATNIGPDGFAWVRGPGGLNQAQGYATSIDGVFLNTYSGFYTVIRYANDAILNLEDNSDLPKELVDRMMGEAKFLRGFSYFYLWNLYGGVIILDKPVHPSETYLPRNTKEEVKNFVINDFIDAIDKLPVEYSSSDVGRATKGAAIAMLGKTYLYDEQWAKAAEQFGKLLDTSFNYELVSDYADLFDFKTQPNSESIFDIQYIMEQGYGSINDRYYGPRSAQSFAESRTVPEFNSVKVYTNLDGSPIDWSSMPKAGDYASEYDLGLDLIPWYESTFENVDLRLHKNIILPGATFLGQGNQIYKSYYPYNSYRNADPRPLELFRAAINTALLSWRKFVNTGMDNTFRNDSPNDFPIVRFGDVLLMYAEAKNEAEGPTTEVYNAINLIRQRAGVNGLSSGLSKDEMQRNIWMERFRELMGETHLYFDVKRWKVAHTDDPIFGLNHDVLDFRGERLFTKVFQEKDYLWPIPALEIELNSKITQNPGW